MDYMDLLKFLSSDINLNELDNDDDNPDNLELEGDLNRSQIVYSEVDDDFLRLGKDNAIDLQEDVEIPVENIVNVIPDEEEEPEEPIIDQEEENFKNLSPAGKTLFLIRRYPLDDDGFQEIFKLSRKVLQLYTAANREGATPEDKQKLVLGSFELHKKMTAYFTNMQKNEPEKFNNNVNVANLAVAYQLNQDLCARAVEAVNGDVLGNMLDLEFTRTSMLASNKDGVYSGKGFEDSLARTMYLSKLKAEFDRVHGTEEEKKAWRSEILNELLSDRFEENVAKFKETDLYKNALKNFGALPNINFEEADVKECIDRGITETAENKYFSVYKFFAQGTQNEKEKDEVLSVTEELEDLRLIGENIGTKLEPDKVKNYGSDPLFDTLYVKKRAKIYGEQDNYVSKLTYDKRTEEENLNRINGLEKTLKDKLDSDFKTKWQDYHFDLNHPIVSYIDEIAACEEKMAKLDQEILELREDTELDQNEKKEALDKASVSRNTQLVLKSMKSNEMFEKFDQRTITEYDSDKFRQCLKEKKQLEALKATKRAEAEARINELSNQTKENIQKEGSSISYWTQYYDDAVKKNKTEEITKIRGFWSNGDIFYKSRYQELYRPVNNNGKDTYVSVPFSESKPKMESAYNDYKAKYGTTEEQDNQFKDAMAKYAETEKLYEQVKPIARPDRSNQKQAEFKPAANPVNDVDLKAVPISTFVHTYDAYEGNYNRYGEYGAAQAPAVPPEDADPLQYLDEAINPVWAVKDVWFGTEEYRRILEGMQNLKQNIINGQANYEQYAKECRKLLAAMDQYIDRKLDERDGRSREKTNSKNRREAVETARTKVKDTLRIFERRAGILGKGQAMEEAANEIRTVLSLSKKNHPQAEDMLRMLNEPEPKKLDVINSMYRYLLANVSKYRKDGKYAFRLKEEEEGRKKRIPANEDERIFKTVLRAFEKLENEYLDETNRDNPQNTPLYLYRLGNIPTSKNASGKSVFEVLGIMQNVQNKEPDTTLRKPENLEDAKDQFRRLYGINLTKLQVKHVQSRMNNPTFYRPEYEIHSQLSVSMVEAAFSALYIDKVISERNKLGANAPQINLEKTEQERLQFVSAIRKSGAFDKLLPKISARFDVSGQPLQQNELVNYTNEIRRSLVTPEKFRDTLVPEALGEDIAEKLNVSFEMLRKPDLYKKTVISSSLEDIEFNLKLAKALGIEAKVEKAALDKTKNVKWKADDFKKTLTNLKDEFTARQVKKLDEPVKKITI
jgi:hypothetical protein